MLPSLRASRSSTALRSAGARLERYGQILALSRGASDCAKALIAESSVTRVVSAAAARFLRTMTISEAPCLLLKRQSRIWNHCNPRKARPVRYGRCHDWPRSDDEQHGLEAPR